MNLFRQQAKSGGPKQDTSASRNGNWPLENGHFPSPTSRRRLPRSQYEVTRLCSGAPAPSSARRFTSACRICDTPLQTGPCGSLRLAIPRRFTSACRICDMPLQTGPAAAFSGRATPPGDPFPGSPGARALKPFRSPRASRAGAREPWCMDPRAFHTRGRTSPDIPRPSGSSRPSADPSQQPPSTPSAASGPCTGR